VAVGTLELEARPYLGLGLPVCALIEAGRSRVYTAIFDGDGVPGAGSGVETHEGLVSSTQRRTLFCGEGAMAIEGMLRVRLRSLAVVPDLPPPTRRPAVLARLGYMRLQDSETDDPASLQPLYMRGAQVQTAERKAKEAR
jgi:tRNA A37 threonylcarbamoyladenosine modification protein TsaB